MSTSLRTDFKAAPGQAGHLGSPPSKRRRNRLSTLNFAFNTISSGTIADLNAVGMLDAAQAENSSQSQSKIIVRTSLEAQVSEDPKRSSVAPPFNPMGQSHQRSPSDGPSIRSDETIVV